MPHKDSRRHGESLTQYPFLNSSLFLQDWNATDLERLSRTVRAVNTRKNVQNFTMVIFPHGRNLIDQLSILNAGLKDLEVVMDLAYFCSSNKGKG